MQTVDIHEAPPRLFRLVEQAAPSEPFTLDRVGKRLVKVVPVAATEVPPKRLGFLSGQIAVPEDFDRLGEVEIVDLFEGKKLASRQANGFELLAMPNGEALNFDPPKAVIGLKPAEFS